MSSLYRRLGLDARPLKMYGFQKVSQNEMQEITSRITRPTYNNEMHTTHKGWNRCKPHRAPSARCRRLPHEPIPPSRAEGGGRKRVPEAVLDKIFKRMRTPTLSVLAANGAIIPSYEVQLIEDCPPQRPQSAPGQKNKSLQRYSRPTTATKNRTFCGFCKDPALKEYLETDYADDKEVDPEELDTIIDRLRTPTLASTLAGTGSANAERCKRRRSSCKVDRKNLPLLSGLSKSKNVDEISNRLYSTPTQAISTKAKRRDSLAATQVTSY